MNSRTARIIIEEYAVIHAVLLVAAVHHHAPRRRLLDLLLPSNMSYSVLLQYQPHLCILFIDLAYLSLALLDLGFDLVLLQQTLLRVSIVVNLPFPESFAGDLAPGMSAGEIISLESVRHILVTSQLARRDEYLGAYLARERAR